jgi:hypothetical protein
MLSILQAIDYGLWAIGSSRASKPFTEILLPIAHCRARSAQFSSYNNIVQKRKLVELFSSTNPLFYNFI